MGSSQAFVAMQIWRAANAMYGTRLTPAEIEDRYLWTDADGCVRLKTDALDLLGDGWAGVSKGRRQARLWIAALLVGAAAFEGAHLAFRRAESPVEPDSCMWTSLLKGD